MKYRCLSTTGVQSLLLLIASSAHAGWQETEWGMSQREVSRMFPAAVVHPTSLRIDNYPVSNGLATVALKFEDGLSSVDLIIFDDDCSAYIEPDLIRLYGEPARQREFSTSLEIAWLDDGTEIEYFWTIGMCSVTYTPEKGSPRGL